MIAPIDGDWAYPNEQPDESSRSYATRMMQRGLDEMQADLAQARAQALREAAATWELEAPPGGLAPMVGARAARIEAWS